jgi:hypothetical protein
MESPLFVNYDCNIVLLTVAFNVLAHFYYAVLYGQGQPAPPWANGAVKPARVVECKAAVSSAYVSTLMWGSGVENRRVGRLLQIAVDGVGLGRQNVVKRSRRVIVAAAREKRVDNFFRTLCCKSYI